MLRSKRCLRRMLKRNESLRGMPEANASRGSVERGHMAVRGSVGRGHMAVLGSSTEVRKVI